MTEELRLALLGRLTVSHRGAPLTGFISAKAQALLVYLAVTGRPHSRDALAALLWGDMPDADARTNLRQALTNLRKVAGPHLLIERESVAFDAASPHSIDVANFERLVSSRPPSASHNPAVRGASSPASDVRNLQSALDLYRGEFLQGFAVRDAPEFEEWMLVQRERLRELALQALHTVADCHAARGEYAESLDTTRCLLALDPWREEAHRRMMRLLARTGQTSAALAQYETCRRVLAKELGVEPSAETTALYERINAARSRPRHNLPPSQTPFVGRETELSQIVSRLNQADCRLLTLIGPGGVGKTRLALEAATRLTDMFLSGVFVVSLASIGSTDRIVSAIADGLGLVFFGEAEPATQLMNYLREKELLLVLDNFEHLLDGTGSLTDILQHAPDVKMLITSRERLNVRGESVLMLTGMSCPSDEREADVASCAAVQLFVQSAKQAAGDFALSAADVPHLTRICRLVEGLPLGIELAAAWTRVITCAEIAREIERSLDFLASTQRDIPARQRNLRAVFDHSWNLLAPQEQDVFVRLSVFRGGFTRDAAEQVAGASLLILSALADKSFIRRNANGRYELHEVMRQYAAERLNDMPGEYVEACNRHCRFYADFIHQRERLLKGADLRKAMAEVGPDNENARAGWQWATTSDRAPMTDEIEKYMEGLLVYWESRAAFAEAEREFAEAARAFGDAEGAPDHLNRRSGIVLAGLLARRGWFCFRLSRFEQGDALIQAGLSILRRLDAECEMGYPLLFAGACAFGLGRLAESKMRFLESCAVYRRVGDVWGVAGVLNNLGQVTLAMGEYDETRQFVEESLSLARAEGIQHLIGHALTTLGSLHLALGEHARAREVMQECLVVSRDMENQYLQTTSLNQLGAIVLRLGDYAEAEAYCRESLNLAVEIGDRWSEAGTLNRLGEAALGQGKSGDARRYFRQALHAAQDIGAESMALNGVCGLAALAQAEGHVERARQLGDVILRHPASEQETKDKAQRFKGNGVVRASSSPQPTPEEQAGVDQRLQDIIAELLAEGE